jgi:hypothetical protein
MNFLKIAYASWLEALNGYTASSAAAVFLAGSFF